MTSAEAMPASCTKRFEPLLVICTVWAVLLYCSAVGADVGAFCVKIELFYTNQ